MDTTYPPKIENNLAILKARNDWSKDEKKKHLIRFKINWILFNLLWFNEC